MKISAQPFDYEFYLASTALIIIDMQRDFIESGGFGETLGNDVSLLEAIVPACQRVLTTWRRWCDLHWQPAAVPGRLPAWSGNGWIWTGIPPG